MSPERFEHLLSIVAPLITKKPCNSRTPISPQERLILTLRFLASGDSQQSQSFAFRLGKTTVSNAIIETTHAIWVALSNIYLKCPTSENDFLRIAKVFENEWNFPNCLGALDGKHVAIECPKRSGSAFFNYKNFFSIVIMAMCDAKYTFTMVDVGGYGRDNDAAIFEESQFGQAFTHGRMAIPSPTLRGTFTLPYVIVGDNIFPLKPWLIKPYPGSSLTIEQRVFNYRLSRCRRTIENAFGILAARWRVYRRPLRGGLKGIINIVKATLCLHNYLIMTDNSFYTPQGFVDSNNTSGDIVKGDWRSIVDGGSGGLNQLPRMARNRCSYESTYVRNTYCSYFNSEGQVPWQLAHVTNLGPLLPVQEP